MSEGLLAISCVEGHYRIDSVMNASRTSYSYIIDSAQKLSRAGGLSARVTSATCIHKQIFQHRIITKQLADNLFTTKSLLPQVVKYGKHQARELKVFK
jgi:hypothetical protein